MSDKKSIEFLQALAAGQRLICEGIQAVQNKIKSLEAELALAKEKLAEHDALILKYKTALDLIAAPKRADGTYNRSREACELLASEALKKSDEK